jgi:hypothetical protein
MAEGERPEPAGAHAWNKENASDTAKRQRAEQAREQAEVLQQARKQDIDSHITELRRQAQTLPYNIDASISGLDRDKQERANVKYKLRYERQANVYDFMKKRYHARTVGDVEEKLRQHQVDAGVVGLWIEGRMIEHDDLLERAIVDGYPELDEAMKQMHEQQPWRQAESVSGFLAGLDVDAEDL